jgi:subtilisin family serine protease
MVKKIMIEPIYTIPPDIVDNDIVYLSAPNLWHLPIDKWKSIWAKVTGRNIPVAILDTGYTKHQYGSTPVATSSFISGQSITDRNSHGTHCYGTAIGGGEETGTNQYGETFGCGIGVAPQAIGMVGKVLSDQGSGGSNGIAAGVRWAVDAGAKIISMSLGGGGSHTPTNQAIDYAFSKGCLVNCAAGNSGYNGSNTIGWPARYKGALCCAAYRSNMAIANFSSGGKEIDWACPGEGIISFSNTGSGYRSMSGTSMATPYGSGVLALWYELLLREGRSIWDSVDLVRENMKANMKDAGAPGFDVRFGMGIPLAEEITKAFNNEDIVFI